MKKIAFQKIFFAIVLSVAIHTASAQEPMIGEIKLFAGNFAPRGWALCQGQLLSVSQNQALFSIIGTFYGGDGRTTFALPDMRGRVAAGVGQGIGLNNYTLGQKTGGEAVAPNPTQTPEYTSVGGSTNQMTIQRFFVDSYGIKIIPSGYSSSGTSAAVSSTIASPAG